MKRIATIYETKAGLIVLDEPLWGRGKPKTPEQAWNTIERLLALTAEK